MNVCVCMCKGRGKEGGSYNTQWHTDSMINTSLQPRQHCLQLVEEDVGVERLEDEGWAHAYGLVATPAGLDAWKGRDQRSGQVIILEGGSECVK